MKVDVITLFPEMVDLPLSYSIVKRAREDKFLKLGFLNPREFAEDKHKTVDQKPYGGGSGMLLMAEPFYKAIKKLSKKNSKVILLSPVGEVFKQEKALQLSKEKHIILVCAHYEGIDERISNYVHEKISIGDFILTGGEPAAVCVIDAITRLLKGVIKDDSLRNESFNDNLLEAPQYTRPSVWRGHKVPEVLLSGDHEKIKKWRREESLRLTEKNRPDLLKNLKI
jgi:tRNA (guanine37-N1)-methyltransferase